MKTNVNTSAKRIISIIKKRYTKEIEKNLSNCSKLEILAKIEKNNILMLDAMKKNDFEKAQKIATENANLLPVVNSIEFSDYKANIKDTEKDFILSVERVLTFTQLPNDEQETLIDIILKEAESIEAQTTENK